MASWGSGCQVGAGSSWRSPKDDPPQPDHPAKCRWLQHDRSVDREVITSKKVGLTCHLLADRVAARWLVAGDPDSYIGQQILQSP